MNLDGPVRATDTAGSGTATVTLSFSAWGEGRVAPTTHEISVQPPGTGPKSEPVAPNLFASLAHPDRKANVDAMQFSPDGQRLFASGYPSGVVQFWDWAAKTEIRRIETPPGLRGSAEYALLTPDWKTIYVPVAKRTVKPFERDGKRLHRIEYSGAIRVWDVASGKEQEPLESPEGSAPIHAQMSPSGDFLIGLEQTSYDALPGVQVKGTTVIWSLKSRERRKLSDGFAIPSFSSQTLGVVNTDIDGKAKKSVIKLLDLATGTELASVVCPDKDRHFSFAFSPNGSLVAVSLGGKLAASCEVWLLDGRTLAERGKFVGDGDPKGYGWARGAFSPDSRSYVVLDGVGKAHVWDTATAKVRRTFDVGAGVGVGIAQQPAFSADGATVAIGWFPSFDPALARAREPDPLDLPQPRITLLDLYGVREPRVLISRHGYVGRLAFSPDGRTLAFGSAGAVHLFDLTR